MLIYIINSRISGWVLVLTSSFLSNRQLQVVLDGKSLQKYPLNTGVPQGSILFSHTFPTIHWNGNPDDVACNIGSCVDDTTLYTKSDRASDLWQQLESAAELESDQQDTLNLGKKWLIDFNTGKTDLFSFDLLGLSFSPKFYWEFYFVSIGKTASKKISVLIGSTKFFSPEVAFYHHEALHRIQRCKYRPANCQLPPILGF